MSHRRAMVTIAAAAVLDTGLGSAFADVEHVSEPHGLYWALTTATTVGYGDIAPHTAAGHWIAALVMLTVVPLFAAAFSLFTSGLTEVHVAASRDLLTAHVGRELAGACKELSKVADRHADALHRRLDDHAELIKAAAATRKTTRPPATGGQS
jgi:voltage-gated potassium channel Kch